MPNTTNIIRADITLYTLLLLPDNFNLFFTAGMWAGLAWLVIAFLISPYGLPMAAAWLVGMIGGANHALRDFVFG